MSQPKVCLFFVVDGKKLEAQACKLATSIQRYFPSDVQRIAYHRETYEISDFAKSVLEACSVELRPMSNTGLSDPNPWSRYWPVGNKLLAKAEHRDCDISVYLDTDMYCRKFVDFEQGLGDADVLACTADYIAGPLNRPEKWTNIYAHFGLDVPNERRRLLAGRQLLLPPYYNGGFVVFKEAPIGTAQEHFGEAWLKDSLEIEHAEGFDNERPALDQTVLPVTLERLGINFRLGSHHLNYNLRAHGDKLYKDAALVHYHEYSTLFTYHPYGGTEALDNLEAVMGEGFLQKFIVRYHAPLNWLHRKNVLKDKVALEPDDLMPERPNDLNVLAQHMGSDKGPSKHRYTELYQMLFWPYIDQKINFLEMGLLIGGPEVGRSKDRETGDCPSIKMWLSFFKKAHIHGLDVSDFSWYKDDRFSFFRCDMGNRREIAQVAAQMPQMDIIIDDAAHASHHQQDAFLEFFPRLKPGGLYVIEDLRWQPPTMEKAGITKTGDLFYHYQLKKQFVHSDPFVQAELNSMRSMIASCFMFQEGYNKDRRNQVAVIHKKA